MPGFVSGIHAFPPRCRNGKIAIMTHATVAPAAADEIAAEIFPLFGIGRQIAPFSARLGGITAAVAYRVVALLQERRSAQGEKPIGRKIGFTNRTIWAEYGVYAPIWGYVTNRSVHDLATSKDMPLAGFAEPRIEPEIVFGFERARAPDMGEAALLGCIDWIAHGFEIVQSIYPHWKFTAAASIAANGLHGALLIGPRHAAKPCAGEWLQELSAFDIELDRNGVLADRGHAADVLDGPLSALRHLVGLLVHDPDNPRLLAGETVTTGTLTRAIPVMPGESGQTRLRGIALDGIALCFV